MSQNTSRGYTYPTYGDANSFPAQIQDMATDMDTDMDSLFDRVTAGYNFAACSVQASGVNQSIANNTDVTATYDTELYDNAAMFTVGTSATNVNLTASGLYVAIGRATFASSAAGATGRQIHLVHSTLGVLARKSIDGNEGLAATTTVHLMTLFWAPSGTFVTLVQRQNTGAAINSVFRQLQVAKMGDL
jgi:hypothetical protein